MTNPLTILPMLVGNPSVTQYNHLVEATQGILTKSVAGSADVTLTEFEAANFMIILTGALTGSIDVKVPQKERPYVFVNATTGAFTINVVPVTTGVGVVIDRGQYHDLICDGSNVVKRGLGMATFVEGFGHLLTEQTTSTLFMDGYFASISGVGISARHARGTFLAPVHLNSGDSTFSVNAYAWARNAGNTADSWERIARYRTPVDSKDAQGRVGGSHEWYVSPGVSAADALRMLLTEAGNLVLGNPASGNDKITFSTEDRDAIAGRHSLKITTENGTAHLLGDIARFNILANGQARNDQTLTELTTIAAAATTTTTIQIPANAVVYGVSALTHTDIPTAATYSVGVSGSAARYASGISTTAGASAPGTSDATRHYAAATGILITPNATPVNNAGRVRITIHYYTISPATS